MDSPNPSVLADPLLFPQPSLRGAQRRSNLVFYEIPRGFLGKSTRDEIRAERLGAPFGLRHCEAAKGGRSNLAFDPSAIFWKIASG